MGDAAAARTTARMLWDAAIDVGGVVGFGYTLQRGGGYEEGDDGALVPLSCDARGDALIVCMGGQQVWRRLRLVSTTLSVGDERLMLLSRAAYQADAVVVVSEQGLISGGALQFAAFAACSADSGGFEPVALFGAIDVNTFMSVNSFLTDYTAPHHVSATRSCFLPALRMRLATLADNVRAHATSESGVARSELGVGRRARQQAMLCALRAGAFPPVAELTLRRVAAYFADALINGRPYTPAPSPDDLAGMLAALGAPRVNAPPGTPIDVLFPMRPALPPGHLPIVEPQALLKIAETHYGPLKPDDFLFTVCSMLRCWEPMLTEGAAAEFARQDAAGEAPKRLDQGRVEYPFAPSCTRRYEWRTFFWCGSVRHEEYRTCAKGFFVNRVG